MADANIYLNKYNIHAPIEKLLKLIPVCSVIWRPGPSPESWEHITEIQKKLFEFYSNHFCLGCFKRDIERYRIYREVLESIQENEI